MAHEVETMAFVGSRGLPWHGLGTSVEELLNAKEMQAAAGLDWVVEAKPMTLQGTNIVVPNKVANVRNTDSAVLGVVGNRYKVIQNDEMFSFADFLLDAGAQFETAGSLRGGEVVFAAMEIPSEHIEIKGDNGQTKSYLVLANGHNGLFPFRALVTPVRVVCMNTLNAALGAAKTSFTIRHTAKVEGKIAEAKRALGITHKVMDEFRVGAEQLILKKMTEKEAIRVITSIFPLSEDEKREKKVFSDRAAQTIAIWKNAENLEGVRETAWGVWNAIGEYLDHGVAYRGGQRSTAADAKASSIVLDTGFAARTKRQALALVAA
jgi:phage/plasmid-like protein (TIGR03299 family)